MKQYLNNNIGTRQNSFIKGRYIEDNIWLLFDAVDFINAYYGIVGSILALNIFKAFDSIN